MVELCCGINKNFLFNHILIEHLLIELKCLGFNQRIVKTLLIRAVLLSLLAWTLKLLFELEFVFQLVVDMLDKPLCGGSEVAFNTIVVESFHLRVKDISVAFAALIFQLCKQFVELLLN